MLRRHYAHHCPGCRPSIGRQHPADPFGQKRLPLARHVLARTTSHPRTPRALCDCECHFLINVLHMSLDCPLRQEHIGCDGRHSFLLGQKAEDLFLARRKTVEVTRLRNCHKRSRGTHRASLSPRVFSLASETALRNHLPVRVQTLLAQQQEARYNHRKRQNDAEARRQIPVSKLEVSVTGVPPKTGLYTRMPA